MGYRSTGVFGADKAFWQKNRGSRHLEAISPGKRRMSRRFRGLRRLEMGNQRENCFRGGSALQ